MGTVKQSVEQAAMKANGYLGDQCVVTVADAETLDFRFAWGEMRHAVREQFTDVERFNKLLVNIKEEMERIAAR